MKPLFWLVCCRLIFFSNNYLFRIFTPNYRVKLILSKPLMHLNDNHIAGEILAEAFKHYPLIQHAFDGSSEQRKTQGLMALYTGCAGASFLYGGVELHPSKQGALVWLHGMHFPMGIVKELKSGMLQIPFKAGLLPVLRLVNHDKIAETWIRKNAGEKMGYIWCVGVLSDARGKGICRNLFDIALAELKARGLKEAWLKTEDPKNVLIYERLGFKVMQEFQIKSSGLPSFAMRYLIST